MLNLALVEKTSVRGYELLVDICIHSESMLTILASCALCLRMVRGVLPRSFPGVLNISVTLLCLVNAVIIHM